MKFRNHRHSSEVKVDMTPLIDVVFLLLIFFMATTTFKRFQQMDVALPSANSGQPATTLVAQISVDAQGAYFYNNQAFGHDVTALSVALKQAQPLKQLMIAGDKAAPHQSIVSVMDMANGLGIEQLHITAEAT